MSNGTWQSFSLGFSNLTEEQCLYIETELNKLAEKFNKEGLTVESGGSGTNIHTDSGEF